MAKSNTKKKNIFVSYFTPFGLRQICDLLMLGGAVVIFIGLFRMQTVLTVGLCIYALASALAIIRSSMIMLSGINKRSPEFKSAMINLIIMSIIFLLAVFGIIWAFVA